MKSLLAVGACDPFVLDADMAMWLLWLLSATLCHKKQAYSKSLQTVKVIPGFLLFQALIRFQC